MSKSIRKNRNINSNSSIKKKRRVFTSPESLGKVLIFKKTVLKVLEKSIFSTFFTENHEN